MIKETEMFNNVKIREKEEKTCAELYDKLILSKNFSLTKFF